MDTDVIMSGDNNADTQLLETSNVPHVDLVIKLGGAAITDKSTMETLRPDTLRNGAELLARCHNDGQTVVVIHGAGSFGHHHAQQYSVNVGFGKDKNRCLAGFCQTRLSVTKLNRHVVTNLLKHNIPAVGCSPFPSWVTERRLVFKWPREAITDILSTGLVPVIHGDCVLDREQGCSILSGDTIIKTLCQNFTVKRVVFLTDVNGIYDKPPSEPGAQLLRQIHVSPDGQLDGNVHTTSMTPDVTGGIMAKLSAAQDIVRESQGNTRVFICKIGSAEADSLCVDRVADCSPLEATEILWNK